MTRDSALLLASGLWTLASRSTDAQQLCDQSTIGSRIPVGRAGDARKSYRRALDLTEQEPARRYLERRLAGLD